ncbi:ap-3 complex subunit mu-1 [Anaeramoeba ignava]|uniref:Ap-3 complex subunit mu-1 n=1 Tax=Anaeramoeba ignava TaxID=1746090 RepID=A0A9Q0LK36_ANAIG|nr:ap-3 complex subunit mu-1 [Anaeramoeba ignava]|eukprot:Anaeramoba_ignava/a612902_96.p1 GENE.a612902_96~~a612902_96.p1  ORF type:complete len:407 (-),score=104.53 a612902_96:149-1369(-)
MIKTLFLINNNGDVIIEKHWRGLTPRSVAQYFWNEISNYENKKDAKPIIQTQKETLIFIERVDMYYLAVIPIEGSPLMVVEFLDRLSQIFAKFFGKMPTEDVIKENFVIIYELLDEMMDNGFPLTTEPSVLEEMINISKQRSVKSSDLIPTGSLSNTPWRKPGIKHSPNEILIDFIERIDTIIEVNGTPVTTEIDAKALVDCRLSGMPELTMSFNQPRLVEDISFHPCVRYNHWEQYQKVNFVPPDGEFQLLTYSIKSPNIQVPIYSDPIFKWEKNKGVLDLKIGIKNNQEKPVENVSIIIPFPKNIEKPKLVCSDGSVLFDESSKKIKWKIGKLKERASHLSGTIPLTPDTAPPEERPTALAEFRVVSLSASGLKVDRIDLHNENYKVFKGVRFITEAGNFQIRF